MPGAFGAGAFFGAVAFGRRFGRGRVSPFGAVSRGVVG